jgi:hypothetical protein
MSTTVQEGTGALLSALEPSNIDQTSPNTESGSESFCALDAVEQFMRRFIAVTDEQAAVLSLFVVHTHAFLASENTAYIRVTADGPAAGKTRVLEVLELLCARPWLTSRTTGPALVRRIAENCPTLLLDETDVLFSGGNASQQMIRGVLNSGYRLGGKVAYAKGSSYEELDVYCPKCFAGIGDLPQTVMTRSIPIVMRPKTAFDKIERLRQKDARGEAAVPKMLAARFAQRHLAELAKARPMIPDALSDRSADCVEAMLAIADIAAGDWPSRARLAVTNLCAERKTQDTSTLALRILIACKQAFRQLDTDRLATSTLLDTLPVTEWDDAIDPEEFNAMTLADTLRPFGVAPKKLRLGRQVLQGYLRRDIDRAWELVGPVPTTDDESEV